MDIRSSVDALKTLLGTTPAASAPSKGAKADSSAAATSFPGDHATLSNVGAGVSQATSAPDVRMEKVAAVQAAIAAGTYQVPASAVAGKVVDAMLGQGDSSTK